MSAWRETRAIRERLQHEVTVYTFRDSENRPLYVGCTTNQYVRFGGHGAKPWWPDLAHIDLEHFEDRREGLRRERQLIRELRPLHNVTWHPERDPLRRAVAA